MAVILATGVDKHESGGVELSLQIFVPEKSGGVQESMASGGGGATTLVRSAVGLNAADAFKKLRETFPREVIWGHDKILIISEKMAKEGIRDAVDIKMRFPEARMRLKMFVSQGKAKNVLDYQPPLEHSTASALRELTELHSILDVPIKSLAQMLAGKSGAAVLPLIVFLPPGQPTSPNQTLPYVKGSAVFKKGRMIGRIDEDVTKSVLLLRNEMRMNTVTFAPKEAHGLVSLALKSKTKLLPRIKDHTWSMTAKIKIDARLTQSTNAISYKNPKMADQLENELSEYIENQIKSVLLLVQKNMHADIFDFAETYYRKYPKEWEQINLEEKFPEIQVHIQVDSRIVSPGLVDSGINRPENEVIKE